jgi:hypothetical protein
MNGNLKSIQLSFLDRQASAKPVAAPKPAPAASVDYSTTTTKRVSKKAKLSATKVICLFQIIFH